MTDNSTQNIKSIINKLGLPDREAEVYLTLLENGPMIPQRIAIKTGIKRTTLYEIFPLMVQGGFLSETKDGKRRAFQAVSPEKIISDYEKKYKEIKASAADLIAIYRMQGLKPEVEVYEGIEGLKKVYNDTLNTVGEILVVNQISRYNKNFLDWVVSEYVPARISRNIKVRALSEEAESARRHMGSKEHELRATRHLPFGKFKFRMEIMIYNDNIGFLNIETGSPLVAIVIRSKQMAETLSALFNLAWEGAERYQKISKS